MLAMPRHEGWLRGFVDGWSLHTGEIVISRKCAQYRRDIPHHQTSLSFQAKEYQLSVRMLLLLYAFLTFVKQSQHKHRAREVLRFFCSAIPSGCTLSLPIVVGEERASVALTIVNGVRARSMGVPTPVVWSKQERVVSVASRNLGHKLKAHDALAPTNFGHLLSRPID